MRTGWQRFRPKFTQPERTLEPQNAVFIRAAAEMERMQLARRPRLDKLALLVQGLRLRAEAKNDPVLWLTALILSAPRAAQAQEQMDRHPHGYHNKQARLYELIDFNDLYVSTVLSLPAAELPTFTDAAKRAMDRFCKRVGTRCFDDRQYEAIVHGLSREIAVYLAAKAEGFTARMTSRTEDAFGIDMVMTDPASGRQVAVDCKTHSSFYYRLEELAREGRLSYEAVEKAEKLGYVPVINRHDGQSVQIILWRIDHQIYGDIQNFTFSDTTKIGMALREIIDAYGT